jgi:diguanylate cyclase (GGDEF)-like protein
MPTHTFMLLFSSVMAGLFLAAVTYAYLTAHSRRDILEELEEKQHELKVLRESMRLVQQHNDILKGMEKDSEDLTLFFVVSLPDLVRQLNANRDKRHIAPMLIRMLELIFAPRQVCVFYRSRDGESMRLTAGHGLPDSMDKDSLEVGGDEGLIGWVAQHQMVMTAHDFEMASSQTSVGGTVQDRLKVDLCAPLIDPDGEVTLGVITVGGLTLHQRYAKKMIKMVADLGSLALKNTEYYRRIRTLAKQDGLTLLYNKRAGAEQLSLAINAAEQRAEDLSVFLFDIDNFKVYNDTNGHIAGDEVLRGVGQILQSCLRSDDFAVRFGGEEFLVVFHDADKQGALVAAENLRATFESHPFPFEESQPAGRLTISGGVASMRTDSRISTELVRLADEALYQAKHAGRNRVLPYRAAYLSGDTEPDPSSTSSRT